MSNVAAPRPQTATINRRIETVADAEAVAEEREGETLDYKGTEKKDAWWELAKDVAAFANHLGGVVLLGAFERGDGTPELRGLPADEVTELIDAYETAARDKCRPSQFVACKRIAWRGGTELLAVNVRAYPRLVGAVHYVARKDKKNPDGPLVLSPTNAWQFPIRLGNDNVPLRLEEAIMHMSTQARRIAIMLHEVGVGATVRLHTEHLETRMGVQSRNALLTSFSLADNHVVFQLTDSPVANVCTVSLDDVDTAWRQDGVCNVRLSGYFHHSTGSAVQSYVARGSRPQ